MNTKTKGFTLIELLVVIAIIGILSSVVLASLNTARNKGTDAAIKAEMSNVRAGMEVFYDGSSTYVGGTSSSAVTSSWTSMAAKATSVGGTASSTGYAVYAQLKSDSTKYFCISSSGEATTTSATPTTTDLDCD